MLFGKSRGTPLVDASDTKVGIGVGVSSGIAVTLIVWEVASGLGAAVCVGFAAPELEPHAECDQRGNTDRQEPPISDCFHAIHQVSGVIRNYKMHQIPKMINHQVK